MKYFKILFVLFLSPLAVDSAEIRFSGFATIAGGITFDDDQSLEGYDDNFSFNPKSKFALQAVTDLGDGWGITAQLLARGSETWNIDAEWAFLSYDASDNWRLIIGRQRVPFYMYSDFLDVGYAYHWIEPPNGVYSLPFDLVDGVGSIYNSSLGSFDSTLHLTYGRNQDEVNLVGADREPDFWNLFSAAWTLNRDWLTLRASYAQTELTVPIDDFDPLVGGWRAAGFPQVADDILIVDDFGYFAGVGIIIDYEDYLVVAEYTEVHPGDSVFPVQDSYYLSFGKRFDTLLVHLTYGADEDISKSILGGVPSGVDPGLDFLIASTAGLFASQGEDSTFFTLGARWEVSDSVAFKAEFTKYDDALASDASLMQFALSTVF